MYEYKSLSIFTISHLEKSFSPFYNNKLIVGKVMLALLMATRRARVGPATNPAADETAAGETAAAAGETAAASEAESIQLRQVPHTAVDEARHAAVDDDETKNSVAEEGEEERKEADQLHREAKRRFLRQAVLKELRDFANYTHICGFERIFNAKFLILRVMWLILFLFALGLTFYQLAQLVERFTSEEEPVKVSTETVRETKLDYPQITICDTNVLSWSRLKLESPKFRQTISHDDADKVPDVGRNGRREPEVWLGLLYLRMKKYNDDVVRCMTKHSRDEFKRFECVKKLDCKAVFGKDSLSCDLVDVVIKDEDKAAADPEFLHGQVEITHVFAILFQFYVSMLSKDKLHNYAPK